jgi:hypothetical protein
MEGHCGLPFSMCIFWGFYGNSAGGYTLPSSLPVGSSSTASIEWMLVRRRTLLLHGLLHLDHVVPIYAEFGYTR